MFPVQLLSACIMVEQLFFFTKKPRVLRYIVVFMNKYGTNISEYRILLGIFHVIVFPQSSVNYHKKSSSLWQNEIGS